MISFFSSSQQLNSLPGCFRNSIGLQNFQMSIINKVALAALVFLAAAFGFILGHYWERMKALPKKTIKIQAPQDNDEKKDQKISSPLKQPGNTEKQMPKSPSLSSLVIEKKITQSSQPPSSLSDNSRLIQQQNSQNLSSILSRLLQEQGRFLDRIGSR